MLNYSSLRKLALSALILICLSCNNAENSSVSTIKTNSIENNILSKIAIEDLQNLKWLNEPESYTFENGTLKIEVKKGTDFFNNPEDLSKTATAPLLYQEIRGDFIAKALVRPDFNSVWNAVALMVHSNSDNWIKFAFENSDATGKSIVSVVTNNISDDANGVILNDKDQIWLKLVRKNDNYAMFWSVNDKDYKMTRLTTLKKASTVKVGIEVQSPIGENAQHQIEFFGIEKTTVKDLRKGE